MQDSSRPTSHKTDAWDETATSGFTQTLDIDTAKAMPTESGYGHLCECYVSCTGPTRLFTATKYGKRYVLKCLKADYLYVPVYQQALVKEFEIGLQLDHPNICRTLGMERLPGLGDSIVMEQVDGDTLQSIIDRKELTADQALKIASQMMDALAYMHSRQVIHRDIKPSNIMVTHMGKNVKIIDFGLSDSDVFHVLKTPAGTYRYIAPEQLLPGAVAEPKADIYSLGMVMEDMAVATGNGQLKRMAKICTAHDASLRPASIEALRKCLSDHRRDVRTLVFLSLVVAVLACVATVLLVRGHRQDQDGHAVPSSQEEMPRPDGNKVVDYRLWDSH